MSRRTSRVSDADVIRRWRHDPCAMVREAFKAEPDIWQQEALRAFASKDHPKLRIALQACAGPGKTSVLAFCAWNFLACYAQIGEHPKGAAVSITSDNLKDNLWSELSKWRERSPWFVDRFEWTKERVFAREHPSTWFISARTWAKSASSEEQGRTLSGLHAKFVLYLIDESGDISPAVGKAAEQGLSNCTWGRIVQAGNPTSHQGMLYQAALSPDTHKVISITADPDDPRRSTRIDIEWAREQIRLYGRENPWVMAYILGVFPPSSINTLLSPDDVQQAMRRNPSEDQYAFAARILGVDCARFGDDPWVIFPRQGIVAFNPVVMRNPKTQDAAGRVALAWNNWDADACFVDDTGGYGGGCIDALGLAGYAPIPVNYSGKANDPRYFNKRAEMAFLAADWVKRGGCLPNIPEIVGEATAAVYWLHEGKLRLEDKAQIKLRLKRSPNYWDAFSQTFAQPIAPRASLNFDSRSNHCETEYDPFVEREQPGRKPEYERPSSRYANVT